MGNDIVKTEYENSLYFKVEGEFLKKMWFQEILKDGKGRTEKVG